jgi:ATP-dependent Clp protease ATP-binding subunit ClpB
VDFKNTIVIMTSNLGTELITEKMAEEDRRKALDQLLHRFFRPELLNRLDDIVLFHSLAEGEVQRIARLQLSEVGERLKDRHLQLKVSESAADLIAKAGFSPEFGARPLRRTVQRMIVDPITVKILSGEIREGQDISVDAKDGTLVFAVGKPKKLPAANGSGS